MLFHNERLAFIHFYVLAEMRFSYVVYHGSRNAKISINIWIPEDRSVRDIDEREMFSTTSSTGFDDENWTHMGFQYLGRRLRYHQIGGVRASVLKHDDQLIIFQSLEAV